MWGLGFRVWGLCFRVKDKHPAVFRRALDASLASMKHGLHVVNIQRTFSHQNPVSSLAYCTGAY